MIRRPAIRALSPYLLTRSANLPRTTILAAVPCQSKNSTSSTSSLPPRPAACRKFSTATQRKDSATAAEPPSVAAQHGHAVSNPTLANIEKRWENMPPQEQAELWMALRDRMTVDWHDMTLQEKRASYWIAFGPHGPRTLPAPGEKWEVLRLVSICVVGSLAVFAVLRYFARPPPKTMNAEWQTMTNEYLKAQGTEAITGVSSEGYEGPGMVQSKPLPPGGKLPGEEDD